MIKIKKNGIIILKEFNEEDKWEENIISDPVVLFSYLNEKIELSDGFTLRDYFVMLENNKEFWVFDNFIPSFIEEYKNSEFKESDMDYLELKKISSYKHSEANDSITILDTPFQGYTELDIYCSFDGIKENETWAIEFSPLDELLDCPLKLGNNVCYVCEENECKTYTADNCDITLYDFIKEIIWELSFCGTPESRNNELKELNEIIDKIDKNIVNE